MSILVFANGDLINSDWVDAYLDQATAVIGVDGGTRHILARSRLPDLVLGDFDSIKSANHTHMTDNQIPTVRYPSHKDETDLELALQYVARQPQWAEEPIYILAALGGRFDQMLANIFLLTMPELVGRRVYLQERYQRAWLVTAATRIMGRVGDKVSLLPLGGDAHIRYTRGLQWPLENEVLRFGPARGVSNVITAAPAEVVVENGRLLCIHTDQTWSR